ncbi:MAG: 23S rRNA (adenine(2503)-C(2))-methyltransferase RlmN [Dehalococcoidia bacterium]|nr:MAG: 23S rRNA (adenine(2503)-C(2))-methyltransferase RlmN [Dehalococcoidia bacterium]
MKKLLLGMPADELRKLAGASGEKEFRGKQVADWIYRQGCREIDGMKNLPDAFKISLLGGYEVGRSETVKINRSKDGTFKLLLMPAYGELIETVGMPYSDRFSCCVSTQVGCSIGCAFCATGACGFKRNLAVGEIIDQVLTVQEIALREKLLPAGGRVSHVVFMGMGEPLINYDATLAAVKLLNTELNIGMRNITVSTIGYVPGIYKLSKEKLQITLAVSLHASEDSLRRRLVPGMSRYKLEEIVEACRAYFDETGRRVSFEYCLLKGINDSKDDAARLAVLIRGLNCHVNLIPYNAVEGCVYRSPEQARVADFRQVLEDASIVVTQREQRGSGIEAACGQLRRKSL